MSSHVFRHPFRQVNCPSKQKNKTDLGVLTKGIWLIFCVTLILHSSRDQTKLHQAKERFELSQKNLNKLFAQYKYAYSQVQVLGWRLTNVLKRLGNEFLGGRVLKFNNSSTHKTSSTHQTLYIQMEDNIHKMEGLGNWDGIFF